MQPNATAMVQPSISPDREILQELEQLVGSQTFNQWFRDRAAIEVEAGHVTIAVKNPFLLSWMQHRFRAAVTEAARRAIGESAEVRFQARAADVIKSPCGEVAATASQGPRDAAPPGDSIPRESVRGGSPSLLRAVDFAPKLPPQKPVAPPAASDPRAAGRMSPAARHYAELGDFVKGPCNELALAAALSVCEQPGTRYNPLVLFGGVGTGKTHLLEGIYRRMRARHAACRALLLTAEGFANCFTQALRDRSLPSFRQRFRTVDVLMIDDVDFLDGKRVIQEEFLHTMKQLETHERQIVLTADRHPRLLTKLSDELVTRFAAGIVCRIESPDLETRRTIVARRAAKSEVQISPDALEFIVQRFPTSVRELEGAINCLETYAIMSGKEAGLSMARQVLAELHRDCLRVIRLADVEETVCRFFGVQTDELRSSRRSRSVSQPRMLAMYLARKMTQAAYSEIGEYFGGRNHSTVMSAEKRVRNLLESETTVRVAAQSWKFGDLVSSLEQQLLCG